LPPFALEYLAQARPQRKVVRWFHLWLNRTGRSLLLEPREIELFLEPILSAQPAQRRGEIRRRLVRYLDWLWEKRLLSFNPRTAWPRGVALHPTALLFVKSLEPTLKLSTRRRYETTLRQFYAWLDARSLTVDTFRRADACLWFQSLHARKVSACTRLHAIIQVRVYFRWLEGQDDYRGERGDHLVRISDLPKLPQYLPRPVPDDLDRVLQRRLRKAKDLPSLGLLLMRRTGLRIGEMRRLPFHCIQADAKGGSFLKVPLGKMNTERLIPLDKKTQRVLDRIRVVGSLGKKGVRRTMLFQRPSGKLVPDSDFHVALERACKGLKFADPMTSHRLRHTYATTMLSAGVSIPVLMKLLGHRSYRMTLRYAAVTLETVTSEYAEALEKIETRYQLAQRAPAESSDTPRASLADLARYVTKSVTDAGLDLRSAQIIVRRLQRLDRVIQNLLRACERAGA
jgi:site-specific recombinase XerD